MSRTECANASNLIRASEAVGSTNIVKNEMALIKRVVRSGKLNGATAILLDEL